MIMNNKKIIKILDYYYLVVLRCHGGSFEYRVTGAMAATFGINLFSLIFPIVLFIFNNAFPLFFFIVWIIIGLVIYSILNIRYDKERRDRIIRENKRESRESRQKGLTTVWLYEILSVTFFILSLFC